jgi:hypothetical protein
MHLCRVQLKFNKCSFYETKEVDNEERQNLKNKNRISVVSVPVATRQPFHF